jgi:hypothetical protein
MTRLSLAALAALIAVPALAQEATVPAVPALSAGVGVPQPPAVAMPAWMSKEVSLDIRALGVLDAVKKVLLAAGVDADKVEADFELPKDVQITLSLKGARANDALAGIARLGGAVAYVSETNGKTSVVLRKRQTAVAPNVYTLNADGYRSAIAALPGVPSPGIVDNQVRRALTMAQNTIREVPAFVTVMSARSLPDKRVSLDKRGADVRDALKDVLKQAGIDYALEEDVPEKLKRSFTFENVPIGTALDVICKSAEIGWRAERSGDKTIVRVGKKYADIGVRGRTVPARTSRRSRPFDADVFLDIQDELAGTLFELPGLDPIGIAIDDPGR